MDLNETLQNTLKDFLVINNNISTYQLILAFGSIVACMACIYIVFIFARRAQNSAYLRQSFMDLEYKKELDGLLRDLEDKARLGPLDYDFPPPDHYGRTKKLWDEGGYRLYDIDWVGTGGWRGTGGTDPYSIVDVKQPSADMKKEADKADIERKNIFDEFRKWEAAETKRMAELRKEAEEKARNRADLQVPKTIDIVLLGGGFSFILEFSTVIVIIFAVLILGIINVMQGREISTILAAIAGYVLGKSNSGQTVGATSKPEPAKPAEPAKSKTDKTGVSSETEESK